MVEHNWKINQTPVSSAPLQKHDKDCGVIVCYCAAALSTEKKSLEFSHNDIIDWKGRQKIAQSIQKKSISESLFNSAIQRSDIIGHWKSNYKRLRPSY